MGEETAQTRLPGQEEAIEPNAEQRELIETIEGPVLVDAGAGTGKTFTIAHRYLHILEARDLDPRDILLITFTNNAAEEMRERILRVGGPSVSPSQLRDAPISTFHALAKRILENHGFQAPRHLGLDAELAPNVSLIENEVRERELFEDFLRSFRQDHPEHRAMFQALHDPVNLLGLVKALASKGIVPTSEGFYREGSREIRGDREAFLEAFREANETDGSRQSDLREDLRRYKHKLVLPHAPDVDELRGPDGAKRCEDELGARVFDQDRQQLIEFVQDVYAAYLTYALDRNVLNFPFLLVLAFVLLVEDDELREQLAAPYVMIDEFQDTSEIQLELALLFCEEPNLCCVGDWKQSIYSFQYASVDNILAFEDRVRGYADHLNADRSPQRARVPAAEAFAGELTRIDLVENYRSTQAILDRARRALDAPGKQGEDPSARGEIVELSSNARLEDSRLGAFTAEDEVELVLDRIEAIVDGEGHELVDEEATTDERVATRSPRFEDIAVLTRTRDFALRLQQRARELALPMAFEGGVEVYRSDAAKLLLAWLRILEDPRSREGWAVVLEEAGYTFDETEAILDEASFPEQMWSFRRQLANLDTIGARARAVFDRYGLRDGVTEALVASLQRSFEASGRTPAEMAAFLEDNLEAATTEPIDDHPGGNVVTAQTIHAAKGLEYPIVIVADLNRGRFPSTGGGPPGVVRFDERAGLRRSKVFAEPQDGPAYVYDDWQDVVLRSCLPGTDHDEERRLFYVAMSRAEQHLVLTAEEDRASPFFEHVADDPATIEPDPQPRSAEEQDPPDPLAIDTPDSRAPRAVPVGELVTEPEVVGGRGRRFGQRLHSFAARYAMGRPVEPGNEDEHHVAAIVDELAETANLEPEVPCRWSLTVEGVRYVLEGKVDLVAVREDRVDIVDWKTAAAGEGLEAYARQVGLYAAIVGQVHEDKTVHASIVYTPEGERVEVEPMASEEVRRLLHERGPDGEAG
ncbi:ATP-dependent DNA helicase [Thermoplasmatales archaeon SW_10_69_26]|nr:MAG: ATP-dependent DNA helicase [Thermoplasmatales archaeon SW_10_69_26]